MASNNALLFTVLTIFLLTGFVSPYLHSAYGESVTTINTDGLETDIGQGNVTVTVGAVVLSLASMFFWTFGLIPVWLDLIFIVLRIILYVIVYDKIRGI